MCFYIISALVSADIPSSVVTFTVKLLQKMAPLKSQAELAPALFESLQSHSQHLYILSQGLDVFTGQLLRSGAEADTLCSSEKGESS